MLLQSDIDNLYLLPACPAEWCDYIRISGLMAKGNRRVEFSVSNGTLTEFKIYGTLPKRVCVNSKDVTDKFTVFAGGVELIEKISIH